MFTYTSKVGSAGRFIWGSKNLNPDVVSIGEPVLIVQNDEFGEPVELRKEPNLDGDGGVFVTLEPGETCSISISSLTTGVFAICPKSNADTIVQCVLSYPKH